MKMKSLKAQFIGAIAMVLVAAIAMGSSTYAWFAMNSTVTAKGMNVEAKVSGSLYIYDSTGVPASAAAIVASEQDFNMTEPAPLKPTSTATLANNAWYTAAAALPGSYEKTSAPYAAVAAGILDDYRMVKTVYVRGESAFTNLQVTGITINGGHDDTIDDAITVAVKCTDTGGQSVFFCNEAVANRNGVVTGADTLSTTAVTYTQVSGTGLTGTLLASGAANTIYTIEIYLYYDGESSSCYTNAANAVDVDGLTVSVQFGATFA